MAFWDDIGNAIGQAASNVGSFFGIGNQQKKKPQPGDPGYVAPRPTPQTPALSQAPKVQTQTPQNLFQGINNDLKLPGSTPTTQVTPGTAPTIPPHLPLALPKPQPAPTNPQPIQPPKPVAPQTTQQTLDQMTQANLPAAQKQVSQGRGVVGDVLNFFTHNDDNTAQTMARTKAVNDFQAKNGYNNDPAVQAYNHATVQQGNQNSNAIKTQNDTVTNVIKKSSEIPVLSDFTALGSGGANAIFHALGDKQDSTDASNNSSLATLGMSDADIAKLPQDQQTRLRALQTGLTVASPVMGGLDIASLGGTGAAVGGLKDAAVQGFKEAGIQGAKDSVIDTGKDLAVNVGKNAVIAGAAAPVVSTPIQNYVKNGNPLDFNGFDPSQIPRESATAALWSTLLPGIAKKPEAEDVNNAKTAITSEVGSEAARAADEAGATTKINVQQPKDIPVQGGDEPTNIPVTNNTPSKIGQPIVEVSGDTPGVNQVSVPTPDEAAAAKFAAQPKANPDQSVSGIVANPNQVIKKADIETAQQTLDDALKTGKITDEQHVDLSNQLSKIPAQDQPVTNGKKIDVKEVNSIPVTDQTTVPTDVAATPGDVRATSTTAPNNTESAAVAAAPTTAKPAALPADTQAVLDNPKQFNKRQVQAARNQLKLAKQYAKTQETTAGVLDRINTATTTPTSDKGFVQTGEFAQGRNGVVQNVHRATELAQAKTETSGMSPGEVIKNARDNQATNGGFARRDIRNIHALLEDKRVTKDMPEYNEIKGILRDDGAQTAQALALRGGVKFRRTATADQLVNQFESKIYRLADDPTKIDSKAFDDVEAATNKYTDARDAANQANNRFTEAPTTNNMKAYHAAQDAADQADKDAKMTEFKVASQVLKGNKDPKQVRELQKMAQDSDLYQMDGVDASMLSGTGTFARNAVNSGVGGAEEGLFGGIASRIANKFTGAEVGGGVGKGTISGFKKGLMNIVDASKARAGMAGKNPLEHLKNFATTGNQLGDAVIDSQIEHNVADHYTQVLKNQGYTGSELANRASVMARQDPEDVGKVYAGYARAAAGLGGGIAKGSRPETAIKNWISDTLTGGNPNKASELTAKLITRMTVGFPSAVGRTIAEGGKRALLGAPTALKLFTKAARDDPAVRAQIIKESIKQAGTGATVGAIFYGLGQAGLVTGSYPSGTSAAAKAEQARWQREGITENSIKIGDNYYQLPSYLGSAALPALFAATLGRNNGDVGTSALEVAKGLPTILPTDQASNVMDFINGKVDPGKFISQTGASAVRALTPAGALLNQVAKSLDPTQNDTTKGNAIENFVDKVLSGIPGENLFAGIPDKEDDQGNPLANPNPLALAFGASSTSQPAGVQETKNETDQADSAVKSMADNGAFSDPNIKKVLDSGTLKTYNDIVNGKQVNPTDLATLQKAMVRGVSTDGSDTAYLEKEQYDSNLTALNLKRQLMAADPTTKPSDLAKMDLAIKRGQVYKQNEIPYDAIQAYEGTSLSDWRAMGDPTNDNYDPDQYQKLWDVDQDLTKAGASLKTGNPDKSKYSAKQASTGRSGGSSAISGDFGKLTAGVGAPTVQKYQALNQSFGSVPVINVVRPNIVHKITSSG